MTLITPKSKASIDFWRIITMRSRLDSQHAINAEIGHKYLLQVVCFTYLIVSGVYLDKYMLFSAMTFAQIYQDGANLAAHTGMAG